MEHRVIDNDCKMYTQQHVLINGRNLWHYLIDTPIGHIHVVECELPTKELKRYIIDGDNDLAEKKYYYLMKKMINENIKAKKGG